MLKITYTEDGFYLEYLNESVGTWIARRALVCLRAAANIYLESSSACVIVPIDLAIFNELNRLEADDRIVEFAPCDDEYIEVSLPGTWVAAHKDSEEGVFVCDLSDRSETILYKLWQKSQVGASVISE